MHPNGTPRAVNQLIFNLGLSVETISLYLLCCGMTESGLPISQENLLQKWNSSEEALARSLGELESMNILQSDSQEMVGSTVFVLTQADVWNTE